MYVNHTRYVYLSINKQLLKLYNLIQIYIYEVMYLHK